MLSTQKHNAIMVDRKMVTGYQNINNDSLHF